MNDSFKSVIEEIELLLAESARLAASGPELRILHRFHQTGTDCLPGEEVAGVWIRHRSRDYPLALSLAPRLLLDYLARRRWLPQSASQIEAGMRRDNFSLRHGANARTSRKQTRRISRAAIKEYVKRIRQALRLAFAEAGLNLHPEEVLVSEETTGNEVRYRLKVTTDWMHVP